MNEPDDLKEKQAETRIELEPEVYGVSEAAPTSLLPEEPIPEHPLHLCPNCAYNLTGLTSRRCPECGKLFKLEQAKERGWGILEQGGDDVQIIDRGQLVVCIGIGLVVFGFASPWMASGISVSGPNVSGTFRAWLMYLFSIPAGCAMLFLCRYFDQSWPRTILAVGAVTAFLGLLMAMV